jgi:uncharacterized protein (DUF2147 family)
MNAVIKRAIGSSVITLAACSTVLAASSPIGVWIDHTGRGAVEITDCGGNLCGRIVWLKDPAQSEGCHFQVIGDVKPIGGNKWDGGWIVDPDKDPDKKYDVEITPLSDQKLKVVGYAGTKLFSETMTWTRAPADLEKCKEDLAKPGVEPAPSRDEEISRRRTDGRDSGPPVTKQTPGPEDGKSGERDTAGPQSSKDCKIEFGGISITFPCKDLD